MAESWIPDQVGNDEECFVYTLTVIAVTSVPMIIAPASVTMITVVIPAITVSFSITRNILAFVPVITYKKDPLAAGMVFTTVMLPISGMAPRDAQIDWRTIHYYPPLNDSRLSVNNPWLREIADVNLAIKAGLSDANRNTNVGCKCRSSESGSGYYR
ncbi:hypothetical protein [Sulfuricurvum sp.]|uniref:hypothetical protein n=1 Tax=Sulfuricurvum sp. TaxID=2025608 RepID=UPI0026323BBA|nr:hypothetical protein [Sulfuricurvum sp.]MDD2266378.1 hypothetical protein [Sulfuricurvum sp.]MDD2782960.1 hypothetical protein [Sulfuricurvum sp.]